jgi:hypothetical protein
MDLFARDEFFQAPEKECLSVKPKNKSLSPNTPASDPFIHKD